MNKFQMETEKIPFRMEPFGRGHTTQCIKNNTHIYAVPKNMCILVGFWTFVGFLTDLVT